MLTRNVRFGGLLAVMVVLALVGRAARRTRTGG